MSYCGSSNYSGWGGRYGNYYGRSHYHHRRYDKVDARNDSVTVDEDGSATLNVLDNDTSKRGYDLSVSKFYGGTVGQPKTVETSDGRDVEITIASDGTLTVTPVAGFDDLNAGETDTVTIWYKASNGRGKTDWAKVVVTIEGSDEAPVVSVENDAVTTGEAEDVAINVLDNDTGDALTVSSVTFDGQTFEAGESFAVTSADGRSGTVTVEADGSLTFTGNGNFVELNDGETDTVTLSYTVGGEGTPARVIDFEGLARGEVVSDQFDGVTVTAQRRWQNDNSPNDAMIFDSNNPTGGDWDLRTNSQDNILIISEDNHSWDPDDNGRGGTFTFTFDEPETVESIVVIDHEKAATFRLTQEDGTVVTLTGPKTSNGGVKTFDINVDSVVSMEVILPGSGALDDLALGAKAGDEQTAEVVITIEGEGSPVTIADDAFNLFENDTLNANILTNDSAEGDLVVTSVNGGAAGESFAVVSSDGRTGTVTVEADGSITFTADGDFETLAVGDSDTITFTYTAGTVGGAGENLIINGDFENNPLNNTGWNVFETIAGWTSPVGLIEVQESNFQTGNTQGNAVVELDSHNANSNATIQQVVEISDAGTYTLSVDYAARGSNFATNGFDIIVNGEVVSQVRPDASGFQNETVELELAAGDAVIQFRGEGTQDTIGTVIDNVELRSVNTTEEAGEATVTIVIDGVNDGPVAADDSGSVTEADDGSFAAVTGNVLTNDSDVDLGDVLSVLSVEGVEGNVGQTISVVSDVNGFAGTAVIGADGSLTVEPGAEFAALNNGESDTVTLTYVVSDGNGGTDEAEVVITIDGAGEAFDIVDDSLNLLENESLADNVLTNDNAETGLEVYNFAGVDAGQTVELISADGRTAFVTLEVDGSLSFTADGDFESLATGQSDTVTFSYAAGTGTPRGENILINGDFENNPLLNTGFVVVNAIEGWTATSGAVEVQESDFQTGNAEGNAVVELDANINSTIEQVVTVTEAGDYVFSLDYAMRGTDAATNGLGVRINGEEFAIDGPTAAGFLTFEANVALEAGDTTIEISGLGTSDGIGTIIDNVALQTAGNAGQQGTADVTITIDGVNDGPTAADDAATVNEDLDGSIPAINGNVLDNDSDIDDGDVLTVSAVNGVATNVGQVLNLTSTNNGFAATAQINADGTVTVEPSDAFGALGGGQSDTIVVTYEVSDGNGGTAEAEMVVTVNGADNGVALNNDNVIVAENDTEFANILANDTGSGLRVDSVEGNPVGQGFGVVTDGGRLLEVSVTASGLLALTAGTAFDNLPSGATDTVRLNYEASDASGSAAEAFIDVTIVGINDEVQVFINQDGAINVNQGNIGTGNVFIVDFNGDAGLIDIDGDAASFSILEQGEFTTAEINPDTGEFTFTGEFGFFGEDTFTFEVSDGLSTDVGSVTIAIVNVDQSPVIDETASDLSVGVELIGGELNATGTLVAFDPDDFDFDAFGNQFPDANLEISVRPGVGISASGLLSSVGLAELEEAVANAIGETQNLPAGASLDVAELQGADRATTFEFNFNQSRLFDNLDDLGFDALSLLGASVDLTYTLEVSDNTASTFNTFSELTVTLDSDDLISVFL